MHRFTFHCRNAIFLVFFINHRLLWNQYFVVAGKCHKIIWALSTYLLTLKSFIKLQHWKSKCTRITLVAFLAKLKISKHLKYYCNWKIRGIFLKSWYFIICLFCFRCMWAATLWFYFITMLIYYYVGRMYDVLLSFITNSYFMSSFFSL